MENEKFAEIISNNCISLVTYRKSGEEVATPVWVISYENGGLIRTGSDTGKLKRIKNNSKCTIAPCTNNGKITGDKIEITAEISEKFSENPNRKEINKKFRKKYKLFDFGIGLLRRKTSVSTIKIIPGKN